eukprot:398313-Pyramimonas_sp.AAC.1
MVSPPLATRPRWTTAPWQGWTYWRAWHQASTTGTLSKCTSAPLALRRPSASRARATSSGPGAS